MSQQFYVRFRGRVLGPMSSEKMSELVQRGQVTRMHEISADGIEWKIAADVEQFYPKKKKVVAALADEIKATAEKIVEPKKEEVLQWYAMIGEDRHGPVDFSTIADWVAAGTISAESLIWKKGMDNWGPANVVAPKLFAKTGDSASIVSQVASSPSGGLAAIVAEMKARRAWIMVLAVTSLFLSAIYLIGMIIVLVREISAPANSGAQAVAGIMTAIIGLSVSTLGFLAVLNLLRYGNSLSVLEFAPTEENVLRSLQKLSAVWLFAGILVLIFLLFIAAGLILASVVSARIPGI